MQTSIIVPLLEKLWLSKNEQTVYCTWLEIGAASIAQLAQHTALKRVTVHHIVEKMVDMGAFVEIIYGKKRLVYPNSYDGLLLLIEEKRFELRQLEQTLESSKSFFDALNNQRHNFSKTRVFYGIEWVSTVLIEQAQDKKQVYSLFDTHAMGKIIDAKKFYRSYQQRALHNITTHLIVPTDFRDVRHLERHDDHPVLVKTIAKDDFCGSSIEIRWSKVALHSFEWGQYSTTIIDHTQTAQMMLMLFKKTRSQAVDYQEQYLLL